MATGLCDANANKPRRYDLTMSRRTRRSASLVANCHQDQDMEESQLMTQQQPHDADQLKALSQCPCASDQLQTPAVLQHQDVEHKTPQQPEDAEELATKQSPEEEEEKTQQQQQQCQDQSRRLSLQELIDEALNGEKNATTGSQEEKAAASTDHEVQEAAAAIVTKQPERVAGRRMIGMMRRYVKVRTIKAKCAPEKNVAPMC